MIRYLFLPLFCGLLQTAGAINPSHTYALTPDSLGLSYAQHTVQTKDGYALNTWIYAPNKENDHDTVLILAYGDAGNMSNYIYFANTFVQKGFTVVTFDYRGFGKSSDFQIKKSNIYHKEFITDLLAIIDFTSDHYPDKKRGIWALSMGTIVAARAIPKRDKKIDFLTAEGFVSDASVHTDRIREQKGREAHLPERASKLRKSIKKLRIPLLVFAGKQDQSTTVADAQKLKEMVKGPLELVTFDGGHLRGFNVMSKRMFGDLYVEKILALTTQINAIETSRSRPSSG